MNTKSSMKQLLNEKVLALKDMIEPEDFATGAKDLLAALSSIPQNEPFVRSHEIRILQWRQHFETITDIQRHYSDYRKAGSKNKQYFKPALNPSTIKDLLEIIRLMIHTCNLPDYYIAPHS